MAYSKVILNGNTLMDTTDKTVDAGSMLSGITALKNDGTTATGTIQSRTASDLTVSGATVTVPAGNYASQATKSVSTGTEGTPTATKGAVSNHSVTVTPSVTNTAGYISGGTKTGTGVSVNVTELESGTKSITENGTGISVSGFSTVDVNVSGGTPNIQSLSVTQNGTYTASGGVDGYSPVTVNVSGGGGSGLVYETGTYTPASDVDQINISFTETHSEVPFYVLMYDTTKSYPGVADYIEYMTLNNFYAFGDWIQRTSSVSLYARAFWGYTTASSDTSSGINITALTPDIQNSALSYWLTTSGFKAYTNTNSHYWKSGRTYKWIAVWAPTT